MTTRPSAPSESSAKQALAAFFAEKMEPLARCREHRAKVVTAMECAGLGNPREIKSCRNGRRCRSGLCPVCVRILRRHLLRFLVARRLHRLRWHFVTIFVAGWTMKPGDASSFGDLRDHHPIENFTTQLKRLGGEGLILVGSIETDYQVVANQPVGKPFHLHCLISGRSEEQILSAAHTCFDLDQRAVQAVKTETVKPTIDDFLSAASYAFKQPFWKKSRPSPQATARRQWPKPAELAELIGNMGVHGWGGRLILVGVRNDNGKFRVTTNLSATNRMGLSAD